MSEATQFGLLRERRFLPFFIAQACGAFNDNLFKNVLIILVTYQATRWSSLRPELLTNIAAGLFIAPFMIFSGIAGQLGERFDKTRILKSVKALEVAIMLVASIGFLQHRVELLLFALFMMGVHSTFFAPAKYGLLPQVLSAAELVGGNAMLETGTFLAILLGTLAGGVLAGHSNTAWIAGALVFIACIGFATSLAIPWPRPSHPRSGWIGILGHRRWITCAPRATRVPCSCPFWACPGFGSSAPWCSCSCRCTATTCCTAMSPS